MRVAVVGGAGFLGSHLVDRFVQDGQEVLVLDDLSSGRLDHLTDARRHGKVGIHTISMEHPHVGAMIVRFAPDVVVQVAQPVPADRGLSDPTATVQAVVGRTARLCEAASEAGARFVCTVDGVEFFGSVAHLPVKETQRPHPLHPFGASLYAAMRYVEARMGRDWCGLVLASLYGPRLPAESTELGRALADMVQRRTPTIAADATAAHDWLYVEDAVDAIARAAEGGMGLMCVGTGETTSLAAIIDALAAEVGYDDAPSFVAGTFPIPAQFSLDATLIESRLGWRPWTSRVDGIKKTATGAADAKPGTRQQALT